MILPARWMEPRRSSARSLGTISSNTCKGLSLDGSHCQTPREGTRPTGANAQVCRPHALTRRTVALSISVGNTRVWGPVPKGEERPGSQAALRWGVLDQGRLPSVTILESLFHRRL